MLDTLLNAVPENWIVFAAAGSYFIGYLIINQVLLRLWVLLGTLFYIWYYYLAIEDPRSVIITTLLLMTSNILGLAQIWYNNSKWAIPSDARDIYPIFDGLPPGDFRALIKTATRRQLDADEVLAHEGKAPTHLCYILAGSGIGEKAGQTFDLDAKIFVGEVSFMTNSTASATATLKKGSEILEWDVAALRKACKNDRFRLALEALISQDLAAKVGAGIAIKKQITRAA